MRPPAVSRHTPDASPSWGAKIAEDSARRRVKEAQQFGHPGDFGLAEARHLIVALRLCGGEDIFQLIDPTPGVVDEQRTEQGIRLSGDAAGVPLTILGQLLEHVEMFAQL